MNEPTNRDRHAPIHLPVFEQGNRANIVFVTVCTSGRKPVLANSEGHELIREIWSKNEAWVVGRYVLLPDHLHLFCSPVGLEYPPLVRWISAWKAQISRRWPGKEDHPLWQRSFWDRQLRRGDSYAAKWAYVRENPIRHGLVQRAEHWPYQGELHPLRWHDE